MKIDEIVAKALVRPLAVIALGNFHHCVTKVALSIRNHLREAFRLDRANKSLGKGAQIRSSWGKVNSLDACTRENDFERIREQRIAIVSQIPTTCEEGLVATGEVSSEPGRPIAVGRRRPLIPRPIG